MQGAAKLTQLQDFWRICGPKHEHPFCFTCTHLSGGALNGSLKSGQTGCAGSYPHTGQKAWFQQGLGVLTIAARLPGDQKLGRCLCPSTLSQSPHQGLQHAQGGESQCRAGNSKWILLEQGEEARGDPVLYPVCDS